MRTSVHCGSHCHGQASKETHHLQTMWSMCTALPTRMLNHGGGVKLMLGADYIRVLYVDLTKEKVSVEERKDLFHLLGGTGVAAKLLEENMHPELPPLHEDQPIVFAIGPLSTIFPVATKTVATFISPLTGEYGKPCWWSLRYGYQECRLRCHSNNW